MSDNLKALPNHSSKIFQRNVELWNKTCPKQAVMLSYINSKHLSFSETAVGELNLTVNDNQLSYPLHDPKGALDEANKWFTSLSLNKIYLVCVYGVGLGYYYDALTEWLKKDKKRRVVFFEDDLAVIQKLFETEKATPILQNPQAQLLYITKWEKDNEVFEAFYWNYAMTQFVFSALESYTERKYPIFDDLRHNIACDMAMKNALVEEYMRYGANFYINFYQNMLYLQNSYLGNKFFGKFKNVPAIICGAGPSLKKNLKTLGTLLDHALVFAGGSALNVLNSLDFQPHFGAGIDPNPAQYERLASSQGYEVPFFYRNRLYHEAFKMIHGPRLYITGAGGYETAEFFEKKLKIPIHEIDEGHNIVNFCVEVANAMGCNPLIFVGMDLAFTEMEHYAPGVLKEVNVDHTEILNIEDQDDRAILKKDIYGQPTYTLWKWVSESEWISQFAKEHPFLTMINCTEGGLGFKGIANEKLSDVAKNTLIRSYELKNRIHGETQNSVMSHLTFIKIMNVVKSLKKSLKLALEHLSILTKDVEANIVKIKKGTEKFEQSGLAALAETELLEEPAYHYVIEIFSELYARILSGEMHRVNSGRYTAKQRLLKKLALTLKKYAFLTQVVQANDQLITYALETYQTQKKQEKITIEKPIPEWGTYSFQKETLLIEDAELNLFINQKFSPERIPEERKDGLILKNSHVLRVNFDERWKISECFIEKEGRLNGQSLLLYPDGKTKGESFYHKGLLHGPSRMWSHEGQLLAQSWFIEGQQQGKSIWSYPSGEIYSIQRYQDNVWHGKQEYYYSDGSVKTLMLYNKGKLVEKPLLLKNDGTRDREGSLFL